MSKITYEIRENIRADWFDKLIGWRFHWVAYHELNGKWSTESGYARTQEAAMRKIHKAADRWSALEKENHDWIIKGEL